MVVLSMAAKYTHCSRAQSLGRGTLAPTIGSMYENDLTHSNAANAAGSRSLQAPCDRTVDLTYFDEAPNRSREDQNRPPTNQRPGYRRPRCARNWIKPIFPG